MPLRVPPLPHVPRRARLEEPGNYLAGLLQRKDVDAVELDVYVHDWNAERRRLRMKTAPEQIHALFVRESVQYGVIMAKADGQERMVGFAGADFHIPLFPRRQVFHRVHEIRCRSMPFDL